MSEELEILKIVVERLERSRVPYFIFGSMAANYYTVPRMTRDIDIVLELKPAHLKLFIDNFRDDFYVEEESVKEEVDRRGMFNLIHKEYAFKVDFIIRKETGFQDSCFKRRREVRLEDYTAWMISREDLVIAKLLWAKDSLSELQLRDVRNLLLTAGNPDTAYLEQWVSRLSLKNVYEKVRT
ncbi:MAG: hypothetical protein HZC18_05450 [Candidatus Omnitrophica bacterium]|nr:hypothetical protein [Candidatus Omnitrophota bacterium]